MYSTLCVRISMLDRNRQSSGKGFAAASAFVREFSQLEHMIDKVVEMTKLMTEM